MIRRTIALDISSLDFMTVGGQIRYASDLIRGLTRVAPHLDLLVIGSTEEPNIRIRDLFADSPAACRYRQFRRAGFKGGSYIDPLRFRTLLHREKVNVFHALHTMIPPRTRCHVVATAYDAMYELFDEYAEARRSRPYRMHVWALRHLAERVICISESTAVDVAKYWRVNPDRIEVVHLGIDVQSPPEPVALRRETATVLTPWNLEPRKNLRTLLEAFSLICRERPSLRLVMYGRSGITEERKREFESHLDRLGIRSQIELPGVVSDAELMELYRSADVFVFPSIYEGFGYPVLEAMAQATPVIARKASAMSEVLGDAGVYVETEDASQLATALASLLDDPVRRQSLGRAARERSLQFTVDRMARETLEVYEKLSGKRDE